MRKIVLILGLLISYPNLACQWSVAVQDMRTLEISYYLPGKQYNLHDSTLEFSCEYHLLNSLFDAGRFKFRTVTTVCTYPVDSKFAADGNQVTSYGGGVGSKGWQYLITHGAEKLYTINVTCK